MIYRNTGGTSRANLIHYYFGIAALWILLVFVASPLLSFPAEGEERREEGADSAMIRYQKFRSDSPWETFVSFPGKLIYFPLKVVNAGIAEIVSTVDKSKIVQKSYDIFVTDDGQRGLYPTSAPPIGVGFKFFQKNFLTQKSKLSISATAGLRGRQKYQIKLYRIHLAGIFVADFLAKYHLQPDEQFYGIESRFGAGGSDQKRDRTNFAHEQISGEIKTGLHFNPQWSTKIVAGFEINNILGGKDDRYISLTRVADKESLPGLDTQVRIARLELEARHDSRNRGVRPISGGTSLLRGGIYQQVEGNRYAFFKLTADFSRNLHLFYNRTLIIRVAGEMAEPLSSGKEIPFYYLSEIGREETVRGFQRGRFHDFDMALGSVEYRYPVWEIADVFLFLDGGKIAHNLFEKFSEADWHIGYGGGIKIWGSDDVITTLTVGASEEGMRVYFGLNREL